MKIVYPILVTLSLLCFTACWGPEDPNKECEVVPVAGDDMDITGKWKLVSVEAHSWSEEPLKENYSCNNIIYHFREDGILSISRDRRDRKDDWAGGDFWDGSTYELVENTVSNFHEFTLVIARSRHWFSLSNGIMELDTRHTDGSLITLVRIE